MRRRIILASQTRICGGQQGSRNGVDEAGGGCPPEWVAGRSLLHVRGLISSSFKQSTRGFCLELEPSGKVNVVSLVAGNREKHLGAACLPAPSFLLFFRICSACLPSSLGDPT